MLGGISPDRTASAPVVVSSKDVADEAALRQRLQAGDGLAYETLVRKYGGRMLAWARRFFSEEQDAADAVQEAFLAAFKAIATFNGDSQLSTWLHRIVINACLMRRRSQHRHPTIAIDSLLPEFDTTGHHRRSFQSRCQSPSDCAANHELRDQVRKNIEGLPSPYREVLILRDIEELDTEATAEFLNVLTAVVKTRLHRARQALRTLLEPILEHFPE